MNTTDTSTTNIGLAINIMTFVTTLITPIGLMLMTCSKRLKRSKCIKCGDSEIDMNDISVAKL